MPAFFAPCAAVRSMARVALFFCLTFGLGHPAQAQQVELFRTDQALTEKLAPLPALTFGKAPQETPENVVTFRIDPNQVHQTILGMGSSLESTTCFNLSRLTPEVREDLLRKLLDREAGIGMNLMRVCIGTSDFTGDPWYSYDDLPAGETDPTLEKFSIEKDRAYILPVLKQALALSQELSKRQTTETDAAGSSATESTGSAHAAPLRFFASPWSPPGWMKSTDSMIGGTLLPEHYAAYAHYFVRFIQAYAAEGIPIYAVTVQNEPGVDRAKDGPKWHYPSCRWTGEQERDFIRDHLGPAFERAGLTTKIWCYDHNFNSKPTPDGDDPGIDFPRTIHRDPAAARYVAGTAFHGYAGRPDGMSQFLGEFPQRPVHFTEGSQFGASGAVRIIDLLRHGASSYNAWVTFIDTRDQPNNGPFKNNVTCVMLDADSLAVQYRFDYYMYGHFMKFILPGAQRLECSAGPLGVGAVALRNPNGQRVVVAANATRTARDMALVVGPSAVRHTLEPRTVVTFRWTE